MIHAAAILTALDPLVGDRVYAVVFPQEPLPTWPAIRFTPVGGSIALDACGGGDPATDDMFVQFDYVATTFEAASALCLSGRAALEAIAKPGLKVTARAPESYDWDAEARVFRAIQDFLFSGSSID